MVSQELLFSEPSIAETGVWCSLSEGIDPSQWARLCRHIGNLNLEEFEEIKRKILPTRNVLTDKYSCHVNTFVNIPLISIGPSGVGGQYQIETAR